MYKAKQKTVSLIVACLTFFVTIVMAFACLFSAPTINVASAAEATATLTFDNTSKRTSFSTTTQVWEENGIVFTNNKSSSTSNVADYAKPVRLYKSSEIVVEYSADITKIVFDCNSNSYATELKNSIGSTATASNDKVTVTLATPAKSFTIAKLSAQVRMDAITITYEAGCLHTNTTPTTVDATCETAGSTTVKCKACGETISTTVIPALGHDVESKPVSNNNGTHTYSGECNTCGETVSGEVENCTLERAQDEPKYTCTECGYFYTVNEYTVSFNVPNDVPAVDSVKVEEGKSTALPSAENYDKYTFVGWTTEEYESNEEKPATVYEAGKAYTVTANATFYALYSYSVGGSTGWNVVTDIATLANNSTVTIVAPSKNVAIGTFSSKYFTSVSMAECSELALIKNTDGTYSFKTGDKYLALTADENVLYTNTAINDQSKWNISISNDVATITSVAYTDRTLQYNASNPRFACYESKQTAVAIWALGTGTTYYTTGETAQPEPEPTPTPETKIDGASITIGKNITVNYYVTMSEEFAGAEMKFTYADKEEMVKGTPKDGKYVFSLNLGPHRMGDVIKAELIFNETVIACKDNYSIKEYAENKLAAQDSSEELKQLITDMLYYGAEAQKYVNYNVENLVTDIVEEELLVTPSVAEPKETDSVFSYTSDTQNATQYFVGADVWFGDVNKLVIEIATTEDVTLTINEKKVDVESTTIMTEGIIATDFDKVFTFVIECNGVTQTLKYSVNSYLFAMQNDSKVGELALALYRYGVSAEAYAN